jgi:hypothetical protein
MMLNFYEDPGHGWLAVPIALLARLDLLDKVSSYSYMRGRLAHLEEDCDYSLFAAAMRDAGLSFSLRERHTDNQSRIRSYEPFSAARARAQLSELTLR